MADEEAWSVAFYTHPSGESPVEAFLAALDQKTQVRFAWSIEQLRLRNVQAREPLVRHLEGKIWELRRESATNIFRLLYVLLSRAEDCVHARAPDGVPEGSEAGVRCW